MATLGFDKVCTCNGAAGVVTDVKDQLSLHHAMSQDAALWHIPMLENYL